MDDLLSRVVDAHGGLKRWSGVSTLTAQLSVGGPFWGAKGWPDVLIEETVEAEPRREHIVFTPARRSPASIRPHDGTPCRWPTSSATPSGTTSPSRSCSPTRCASPRGRALAGGRRDVAPAARHVPRHHRHPQSRAGLLLRRRRHATPNGLRPRSQRQPPDRP